MVKLLICYLNKWGFIFKANLLIICFLYCSIFSCQQAPDLYKKEFSPEEKKQLAIQFVSGIGNYYQGSVPERFLLKEGLSLDPTNVELNREMGIPALKRGIAVDFEYYYNITIGLDPKEWQGWRGYLYLYFYRDYERAIADFDATDTLTPNFVDYPQANSVHYMRAICYLKLAQYDQALTYLDLHIKEELKTTTEDYIDCKTFLYQGLAHYKKGDFTKAKASFQRGTDNAPYNADLWFWTAKLALESGQKNTAMEALKKANTQYQKDYQNQRPYVEGFFQIYQSDLEELEREISFLN